MRLCKRKSRLCRVVVGILCVTALVHLVWLKGDLGGRGQETVDNGRRQASGNSIRDDFAMSGPQISSKLFTGTQHRSATSESSKTSRRVSTTLRPTFPPHDIEALLKDMILDTSKVKVTPKNPVVLEGHPMKITCMGSHLLKNNVSAAPYMTIQLPNMSQRDKRTVRLQLRPGVAVVTIRSVRPGHEGAYVCIMVDHDGSHRYNTAQLHVKKRGGDFVEVDEGADYENDVVELGGMEIQAVDPRDAEKVDRNQILELRQRVGSDLQAMSDVDKLLERGKLQEKQVKEFCLKYNFSHQEHQLPGHNESEKSLFRHLLVYDKMKTLFAFVPKTGCTNLRLLFFLVQGYIPLSQFLQSRDAVDQNRLEAAQFQESFFSRNAHQRRYALEHYFKFIMYRNPLDRLVSGYRSKVSRFPLISFSRDKPHYNWLRNDIALFKQPKKYQEFIRRHGNMSINITFSDFIDYWVEQPKEIKYDEHFRSIFSIAQPCRVQYNFYGNFKHFERDAMMLAHMIKAPPQYLRKGYYSNKESQSTEDLAPTLYAQLSTEQKLKLLEVLAQDLEFYYTIFPDEKDMHKTLLGIPAELPITKHE